MDMRTSSATPSSFSSSLVEQNSVVMSGLGTRLYPGGVGVRPGDTGASRSAHPHDALAREELA